MELTREELRGLLMQWVMDKKAENIEHFDVAGKTSYVDELIICTGGGNLHVRAIADHVIAMAKENKIHMLGREGLDNNDWVLIDFGEIILHVFRDETRQYYKLEQLWETRANNFEKIETLYD